MLETRENEKNSGPQADEQPQLPEAPKVEAPKSPVSSFGTPSGPELNFNKQIESQNVKSNVMRVTSKGLAW